MKGLNERQYSALMMVFCTLGFVYGSFVMVRYLQEPEVFQEFAVLVFLSLTCIPLALFHGRKHYELLTNQQTAPRNMLD